MEVRSLAEVISRVGPDDEVALSWIAVALVWVCGDCAASGSFIDKAIAVNPNLATAWQVRGYLSMVLGRHDEALTHYARATRLSPIGQEFHIVQGYIALSMFWLGQNDEAIQRGTNAMSHLPLWLVGPLICTAAHGLAGNAAMAQSSRDKLLGIRPGLNLSAVRALFRFYRASDSQQLVEGMRLAGLPE
jgi:tetratricopeptide (TPR) repeat protein